MEFSSLKIFDILSDKNVISDSIAKKLIRSLTENEKRNLDLGGNAHHPDDTWADILYFSFDTPELPPGFIKNCYFGGKLFISYEKSRISSGSISNKDRNPFGLYNSNFSGICIVDFTSRLWNVSFISNMIVDSYSSITNCSNITNNTSNNESSSGIFSIHVGAESNPRILKLNKYNTYNSVCKDAINFSNKSNDKENLINQSESNLVSKKLGKVGENSEINDCPFIKNCFIGNNFKASFSILDNCDIGDSCTVYSTKVKNVIMHDNSVIDSALLVDSAVLFDATSISEGARVNHSIIGPDASVAGGECHHSIVGPMAGFHHTSLLIAAIWPLGRGNLAYGSMIGANHTGRIADQECFPGEGCFFGLASALKFPQNLIESPYSIIVSGTICPAQKVTFPFSLISKNENNTIPSVLPSLNLIKPGWVFQENSYMVERNVSKFTGRRKSKEYSTDFDSFRPSIIEMVYNSREKLNSVNNSLSEFYSDKQINGLGQNVLLEKDRLRGISAYSDIIKLYALRGLYEYISSQLLINKISVISFLELFNTLRQSVKFELPFAVKTNSFDYLISDLEYLQMLSVKEVSDYQHKKLLHQIFILYKEFEIEEIDIPKLIYLLNEFINYETIYSKSLITCRSRDDSKGLQVFGESYFNVHVHARDDPLVNKYFLKFDAIKTNLNDLLAILS